MNVSKIVVHGDDTTQPEVVYAILDQVFTIRKSRVRKLWRLANSNVCGYTTVASGTNQQMMDFMDEVRAKLSSDAPGSKLRFSIVHGGVVHG